MIHCVGALKFGRAVPKLGAPPTKQDISVSQQTGFFARGPRTSSLTVLRVPGTPWTLDRREAAPFDAARVRRLRAAIASGTYRVDAMAVAEGLLHMEGLLGPVAQRHALRRATRPRRG